MKFVLGLAVIILMASIREAHACSCYRGGDPAEAVAQSEVVFLGTVAAAEQVLVASDGKVFKQNRPGEGGGRPYRAVVLRVAEKWRGDAGPFAIVATGSGGGDCGYGFEVGKSYVVYAAELGGRARR